MEYVQFMTNEEGDDLIVSFALSWGDFEEVRSLILQRTPKYEFLFDESERGVRFSDEAHWDEEDWLLSIDFGRDVVRLETQFREYELDVSGVDRQEWKQARRILKKMNFDRRFDLKLI
ncbi:MAG: hypothetical protein P1P76_06340 [Anaerolineales bacterium]|nr:hypothetical protein [Anaerolineales bacterium]